MSCVSTFNIDQKAHHLSVVGLYGDNGILPAKLVLQDGE